MHCYTGIKNNKLAEFFREKCKERIQKCLAYTSGNFNGETMNRNKYSGTDERKTAIFYGILNFICG